MAELITITADNFDQIIEQSTVPVVVIFGAVWSTASQMLLESVDEAMPKVEGSAIWGTVDLDVEHTLAERFSIITMPTILVIHNSQIVKQYFGVQEPDSLVDMIKELTGEEVVKKPEFTEEAKP